MKELEDEISPFRGAAYAAWSLDVGFCRVPPRDTKL